MRPGAARTPLSSGLRDAEAETERGCPGGAATKAERGRGPKSHSREGPLACGSPGGPWARAAAVARWAVPQGAPGRVWGGNVQERAPCGLGSRSRPPRLMERGPEVQRDPHGPGTRASRQTECEEVGAGPGRPASMGKADLGSTVNFLGERWEPLPSAEKILTPAFASNLIPSFALVQGRCPPPLFCHPPHHLCPCSHPGRPRSPPSSCFPSPPTSSQGPSTVRCFFEGVNSPNT